MSLVRIYGQDVQRSLVTHGCSLRQIAECLERTSGGVCYILRDGRLWATVTDGDLRRLLLSNISVGFADLNTDDFGSLKPCFVKNDESDEVILSHMNQLGVNELPLVGPDGSIISLVRRVSNESLPCNSTYFVIMAGGKGRRMGVKTVDLPKPMLEVGGKPLVEHIILNAKINGFNKFVISVNYLGHVIEDYFGDGSRLGVSIEYYKEQNPLGTAGSLYHIVEKFKITGPFMVSNGDIFGIFNFQSMMQEFRVSNADVLVCGKQHVITNPYGEMLTDGTGNLLSVREKPEMHSIVNAGVYVVSPDIIKSLLDGGRLDITELMNICLQLKKKVKVFLLTESWRDVGTPADLSDVNEEINCVSS